MSFIVAWKWTLVRTMVLSWGLPLLALFPQVLSVVISEIFVFFNFMEMMMLIFPNVCSLTPEKLKTMLNLASLIFKCIKEWCIDHVTRKWWMWSDSSISSYLQSIGISTSPCAEACYDHIVEYKHFSVPNLEISNACSVKMLCKYISLTYTKCLLMGNLCSLKFLWCVWIY